MSGMKLIFILLFFVSKTFAHEGKFHLFLKNWNGREVHVYLPVGYEKSQRNFPVLFMQDGQNAFDPSRAFMGQTWKAEETLNRLISQKKISPIVVVAVDNTPSRLFDYTHDEDPGMSGGGGADRFLDQLEFDLIPLIEKHVKVKKNFRSRGILGSSLGGLVSLYAGFTRKAFGKVGALSPSIWWNDRSIIRIATNFPETLYMDSGTLGGERPQDVKELSQRPGSSQSKLKVVIEEGAYHREEAWARRLPEALEHLFPL